jgi:hypothetical protein
MSILPNISQAGIMVKEITLDNTGDKMLNYKGLALSGLEC